MKQRLNRWLSGLLAAAVCFGMIATCLPVVAFAEETAPPLLLQDGWTVKKGDTVASADGSQGSTQLITVGGEEMTLVTSGANNGNGHFGSTAPEAFYLTNADTYTDESFSFTFVIQSDKNETRLRIVNKYKDDTHWSYLGYDGYQNNDNWFVEFNNGDSTGYPSLSGLPSLNTGDKIILSGSWNEQGQLAIQVNNLTTGVSGSCTVTNDSFNGLKEQAGKMGIGGATYSGTAFTSVAFSDVTIGDAAYEGEWGWYKELEGQSAQTIVVGGTTQRLVAAGANNGNTKTDKAYVTLPGVEGAGAGTLTTTFANVTPEGTVPMYAVIFRYTDANHWAAVGHDGTDWYVQSVNGSGSNDNKIVKLPGVQADPKGTVALSVSYEKDKITAITINDESVTFTLPDSFDATLPDGTIGYLLSQNTQLQVSSLEFVPADPGEPEPEPSPDPSPDPGEEGGKKWVAFNSLSGGHNYGQASGPAFVINPGKSIKEADQLTLELRPIEGMNFGIFYYYLDDNNWLYVGYDTSSGWYYQFKNAGAGSYPKLNGLPSPVQGESMEISISLSRETLMVTVNGVTAQAPNQSLSDLSAALAGKTLRFGPMAKGSKLEFASMALNGESCMDNLAFLVERNGQTMTTRYSALVNVTGTVLDENSQPMEGATVRLGLQSATTDAEGSFTLEKVESGDYTLAVTKPGYQAYTQELTVEDEDLTLKPVTMSLKPELNLEDYDKLATDEMTVYVGKEFPLVARYYLGSEENDLFFRGQESALNTVAVNGVSIEPTNMKTALSEDGTYKDYTFTLQDAEAGIDLEMVVRISVSGADLTWEITRITKNDGCAAIATIDVPQLNLITVDAVDEGANFAGAKASTDTTASGDTFLSFEDGFIASESDNYMYGILSTDTLSAGIYSNSEAEGDKRIQRNNGADTISLTSTAWYVDMGDKNAQKRSDLLLEAGYPTSELPWVKVALAGDLNEDGGVDWNDGALASRRIVHVAQGSEEIKDLVNYRIVMNFASMAPNPYLETADNIKKVYLATDGLGQAVMLKGYGSEGHDSANSEYADISEQQGGVEDFQKLIQIAHQYGTEIGIHVNAQEAYPEANSFSNELVGYPSLGNGWGWLDQSYVIDKLWDLSSQSRWKRFVQLYDRINGTSLYANAWPGAVGEGANETVATMAEAAADAATRPDNMDFIYLDVWYQDAWETRRIAEQVNSLGWRFSTEFSNEGEYDSTWQHWSTDAVYGGATMKGYNSDIIRFIRNDQRDSQVLNWPSFGGTADNPLLGGYWLAGFEGWGGDQNFTSYIYQTFNSNLPTRWLQHYYVTDWETYAEDESPVGNHEKQITLKNDEGDVVVVTRNEAQRNDDEIERTITLNGKVVLNTDVNGSAYLLPWTDSETGEEKLYHWNLEGASSVWQLQDNWAGLGTVILYELSDQGRGEPVTVPVAADGTIVLDNIKPATAYVVVAGESRKTLKADFGEGTYLVDPGFNGYADGGKLDSAEWSGSVGSDSVYVEKAVTGDQKLVFDSPVIDVAVSTTITGLTAGEEYVAQVYVDNQSDVKASITVDAGKTQVSNYTLRSYAGNYVKCDEEHLNTGNGYDSKMQVMLVSFIAESDTATLTLSREAGEGFTWMDDMRVIQIELGNYTYNEDGSFASFEQGFETTAQGIYPFVLGPAQGVSDPVTHLAQLNAPYTQKGYLNNKATDDVLNGEWSLKHHGANGGILYYTIPQNFRFEPGKLYNVTFSYQSGPDKAYAMVVGDGSNYTPASADDFLPAASETQTVTLQVVGSTSGQTWIGIYSDASKCTGTTANGQNDFILDDLVITVNTETSILTPVQQGLKLGETLQLVATNLEGATYSVEGDAITLDEDTLTVSAVKGGVATVTASKDGKDYTATITVVDKELLLQALPEGAAASTNNFQEGTPASNAVDGDSNTVWHTSWTGFVTEEQPAILTIDLGSEQTLSGFAYQNRPSQSNGIIEKVRYEIGSELDADGNIVNPLTSRTLTAEADGLNTNPGGWTYISFADTLNTRGTGDQTVRYIQLIITDGKSDSNTYSFASIAEVRGLQVQTYATQGEIVPPQSIIRLGMNVPMELDLQNGDLVAGLVWTSSNPGVVTVSKNGVLSAVGRGTATITVTNAAGLKSSQTITVLAAPIDADATAAGEAYDAALELDLSKYQNGAEMDAFLAAMQVLNDLLWDASATQSQLDEAVKALTDAQAALVPVSTGGGSTGGGNTGDSGTTTPETTPDVTAPTATATPKPQTGTGKDNEEEPEETAEPEATPTPTAKPDTSEPEEQEPDSEPEEVTPDETPTTAPESSTPWLLYAAIGVIACIVLVVVVVLVQRRRGE